MADFTTGPSKLSLLLISHNNEKIKTTNKRAACETRTCSSRYPYLPIFDLIAAAT